MTILDLSHPIAPGMPVYPGTDPPKFQNSTSIALDGFAEKRISMFTHTGTHMDAPAHIIPGAKTLDQFPVDHFYGPGLAINVTGDAQGISIEKLRRYDEKIRHAEFLLLCTGWSEKWGSGKYFEDFPVLTGEAADWLTTFELKGIAIDAISIDPVGSMDLPNHRIVLAHEIVIIENLRGIEQLPGKEFVFSCLPLRLVDADGSPVRATAILSNAERSR